MLSSSFSPVPHPRSNLTIPAPLFGRAPSLLPDHALAGYTTSLRHSESASTSPVWPRLRRLLSDYYPMFLVTSLCGMLLATAAQGHVFTGRYILMLPFGASA
jgi:hypothetical protein